MLDHRPRLGRTPRGVSLASGLSALLLGLAACAGGSPRAPAGESPRELRVLAASSLTEAFQAMAPDFEAARPEYRLSFDFAGSDALVERILAGEPADVFAAADERQMARLVEARRVEEPRVFAGNRLALVHRPELSPPIVSPADFSRPGLRLALAGPEVPAGRYARQALTELGAWPAAEANLVAEAPDAKAVLELLLAGRAEVGIVYVTDMTPAVAGELGGMAMPPAVTVRPRYPAARLREAREPRGAQAFLDFLMGHEAATALAARGFTAP